jgi:hypothetical protein
MNRITITGNHLSFLIAVLLNIFPGMEFSCFCDEKSVSQTKTDITLLPLLYETGFEQGAADWEPTDPDAWQIKDTDKGKVYSQNKSSKYSPPFRSPFNISILKNIVVGDFVLDVRAKSTKQDYPHRDLCIFFGYQDPTHFYYAHLGKKTDTGANQVHLVDGAPRRPISKNLPAEKPGIPWDDNWHNVRVVRSVADGTIEVFFDDMSKPVTSIKDSTLKWGRVGLGSFDDTGDFDDFKLTGIKTDVKAVYRTMRCNAVTGSDVVVAWQNDLRAKLFKLLRLDDLVPKVESLPFDSREDKSWSTENYTVKEITIQSTPARRIEIIMTMPKEEKKSFPAVVCIGGHGSTRHSAYINGKDFAGKPTPYKGFASELAAKGYVTISTLVSQHKVYESDRTLMGERLWDLMRCVSYLKSLPTVDKSRIGCGGLSLGGEMTMWLAAMDPRIAAADSCGFLTCMDQMEKNHCMCWKFDGLRELVDYSDIYSLIAPRALECQNGRKEPPTQFTPELAQNAMDEICPVYKLFGKPDNVSLDVHDGGHEVDLPALFAFFDRRLKH